MDYQVLYQALDDAGASAWRELLADQLAKAFDNQAHGDLQRWQQVVAKLPRNNASVMDLQHRVQIGIANDLDSMGLADLNQLLTELHPWRKGPYDLFGIHLDCEWRSDWKWDRLKTQISPLHNRLVLDVGCGNGYHCWRMLGAGARMVIGIDPTLLSVMQFEAIRALHGEAPIYVLPIGIEQLPPDLKLFDTVFSMGVLYHRRSPIDHLLELKACLRPGGELLIETLVVDGDIHTLLMPEQRYAQMRNVWFLPSAELLMLWMRRCGYKNIRLIDITKTTIEEQRSTEWMRFHSLAEFLDPNDHNFTCEGLPAPKRAIVIAEID